ncbi:MAG: STY0301 family protein [Burkholderiales bacterium]
MRQWLCIALVVSPLPALAADWKMDCPAQLATAQTITGTVPADWSPIARGVSAVRDAKPPASDTDSAPAVAVSIFDGPPSEMADLVPDDPNARVVRWTFAKNRTRDVYVVCHYADTRLALSRKAPAGITSCQLQASTAGVVCR